jgi:hypothetical protein
MKNSKTNAIGSDRGKHKPAKDAAKFSHAQASTRFVHNARHGSTCVHCAESIAVGKLKKSAQRGVRSKNVASSWFRFHGSRALPRFVSRCRPIRSTPWTQKT